jgi:hypothetical protein
MPEVNARRELDEYLAHLSVADETRHLALLAQPRSLPVIADLLRDRTVLVDLWLGNDEQRRLACYTTVVAPTRPQLTTHVERRILSAGPEGDTLEVTDRDVPGYRLMAYPLAPGLAKLRVELRMQPDTRPVSRFAQQPLEELTEMLFGGSVPDVLGELSSQGFRHLCLWPHGPLWNMPLQLLMPTRGHPLADDWPPRFSIDALTRL